MTAAEITVRRHSDAAAKRVREMMLAEPRDLGEFTERHVRGQIAFDVVEHAPQPPRIETSATVWLAVTHAPIGRDKMDRERRGETLGEEGRRQALFREGAYHDVHVMAVLREEWQL